MNWKSATKRAHLSTDVLKDSTGLGLRLIAAVQLQDAAISLQDAPIQVEDGGQENKSCNIKCLDPHNYPTGFRMGVDGPRLACC